MFSIGESVRTKGIPGIPDYTVVVVVSRPSTVLYRIKHEDKIHVVYVYQLLEYEYSDDEKAILRSIK